MGRTQGAIAFLRTSYASTENLAPDIMLQLGNSLVGGIFKNFWNIKNEVALVFDSCLQFALDIF